MKKKTLTKMLLDILLAVVFTLMFDLSVPGGLTFHEIAGLGIGIALLIHLFLNWKWIKQVTILLFSKKVNSKMRFGYVVDFLLLIGVSIILISGVLISKVVFGFGTQSRNDFLIGLHYYTSYFLLILIGIHVGLHWDWVIRTFKKVLRINRSSTITRNTAKVVVRTVFVLGLLCTTFTVVRLAMPAWETARGSELNGRSSQISEQMYQDSAGEYNSRRDRDANGNEGFEGHGRGSRSPLLLVFFNSMIISAFAIPTYYIEKNLSRKGQYFA